MIMTPTFHQDYPSFAFYLSTPSSPEWDSLLPSLALQSPPLHIDLMDHHAWIALPDLLASSVHPHVVVEHLEQLPYEAQLFTLNTLEHFAKDRATVHCFLRTPCACLQPMTQAPLASPSPLRR